MSPQERLKRIVTLYRRRQRSKETFSRDAEAFAEEVQAALADADAKLTYGLIAEGLCEAMGERVLSRQALWDLVRTRDRSKAS